MKRFRGIWSSYEADAIDKGYRFVAGVDEAGRGPLAGPVVASAVLFSPSLMDIGIRDSKLLSEKQRESILKLINKRAIATSIGIVWPSLIDEINIHRASLLAMQMAADSILPKPHLLLVDGPYRLNADIPHISLIKGDSSCISIAAASIVAKTTRDHIMYAYDRIYPHYRFAKNKGYGTVEHREALLKFGGTPIHRKSFSVKK